MARVLVAVAVAGSLTVLTALPADAMANLRKYAGIVVDAKTGDVLYQQNADDARYPASITKVMTLYILFQELAAGHLKLDSLLNVSPYAASASPTKLGLRAGSKIRVEDAIKSIVTISANDMARTIAENISGSETAFAARMTATAKSLGMGHTRYVNASGLPDERQLTTVRDQSILASAMYEHFPQYYHYFQTKSFAYGKRVYGNHDNVLGFMGVDGMKTGYINAAGYNLMTATRMGDRHLVVIGFGFNTGGQRDATVRWMVKKYLPKARAGTYLASAMIRLPGRQKGATTMLASLDSTAAAPAAAATPSFRPMPAPAFRQDDQPMPDPVAYAPEPAERPAAGTQVASLASDTDPDGGAAPQPMDIGVRPALAAVSAIGDASSTRAQTKPDVTGQSLSNMLLGAPPTSLGDTRPSAPLVPPVGIGQQNQPIDLFTSGGISSHQVAEAALAVEAEVLGPNSAAKSTPATSDASAPAGSWIVQIGAAPSQDGAKSLLDTASGKVATLNDMRPYVERFDKNGQTFFRARFIGFGSRDEASGVCSQLKKAKMSCLAMQG